MGLMAKAKKSSQTARLAPVILALVVVVMVSGCIGTSCELLATTADWGDVSIYQGLDHLDRPADAPTAKNLISQKFTNWQLFGGTDAIETIGNGTFHGFDLVDPNGGTIAAWRTPGAGQGIECGGLLARPQFMKETWANQSTLTDLRLSAGPAILDLWRDCTSNLVAVKHVFHTRSNSSAEMGALRTNLTSLMRLAFPIENSTAIEREVGLLLRVESQDYYGSSEGYNLILVDAPFDAQTSYQYIRGHEPRWSDVLSQYSGPQCPTQCIGSRTVISDVDGINGWLMSFALPTWHVVWNQPNAQLRADVSGLGSFEPLANGHESKFALRLEVAGFLSTLPGVEQDPAHFSRTREYECVSSGFAGPSSYSSNRRD